MTDSNFGNRALCLRSPKSVSSNKVAIARALEEEMGNRQGQRTDLELVDNCPQAKPTEKVAIARAIEEDEKKNAKERQGRRTDLKPDIRENSRESSSGRSDVIAAKAAGFGSEWTYRKAKQVVDHGAEELVEAMDAGRHEKARTGPGWCDAERMIYASSPTMRFHAPSLNP
ncbi:hypothetical protein ABZN20_10245 [Methylococcus sp. ANG]|uniref:hypothetical protein n=1 Tax=Methylococcus sp. ANG TaxID=3231903 RepID=UPI00345B32C2